MHYLTVPVTDLEQNCTILWCNHSHQAVVVDPGGDVDDIQAAVKQINVKPIKILLTHGHFDHVGGATELAKCLSIPIIGPHIGDLSWLKGLTEQSRIFGLRYSIKNFVPDHWLNHGDTIKFGNETLEVLHCPGHTPGHVVYFNRQDQLALVGDVLFKNGIGRTDFPGSSHAALMRSIQEQLWPLGDTVRFIPGHGPMSSFGEERLHSPFFTHESYNTYES